MRLLDTRYGIRREDDHLKIGNSTVTVDNMRNTIIKGKEFKGTEDLWKLLTRINVNYDSIIKNDLQRYKTSLETTNGHLEGYRPVGNIQTSRGTKFKNVIGKHFPEGNGNSGQLINMISEMYCDPAKPLALSTLNKLGQAAKQRKLGWKPNQIKSWLESQEAYTMHRPLRHRFPRNPCTVNNILDV